MELSYDPTTDYVEITDGRECDCRCEIQVHLDMTDVAEFVRWANEDLPGLRGNKIRSQIEELESQLAELRRMETACKSLPEPRRKNR